MSALQSRAFQRASLKSESYRVVALLCVLVAGLVFVILRGVATHNYLLLFIQSAVIVLAIVHEAVMWRAIRAAIRNDAEVSPELWVFNILIESQLPTVSLFVLLLNAWITPATISTGKHYPTVNSRSASAMRPDTESVQHS